MPEDYANKVSGRDMHPFGCENSRIWAYYGGFNVNTKSCVWHFEDILPPHMSDTSVKGLYSGSRDCFDGKTFSFEKEAFNVYLSIKYESSGAFGERHVEDGAALGYIKSITKLDDEANKIKVVVYDDMCRETYVYTYTKCGYLNSKGDFVDF